MTLVMREATSADEDRWTTFVASRPEADVLQSWAWGEAGAGEPDERWSRFVVLDAAGDIRGIAQVLARATSFGRTILYVPHGPVWDREAPDAAETLARLLLGLKDHGRRLRGVVVKLDPRASADATITAAVRRALLAAGTQQAEHDLQAPTTRIIDLLAADDPVSAWSKDARAEARRAEREGTTVAVDRKAEPALLDAFHELLSQTSQRQGFRIRSRAFLDALSGPLVANDAWHLALAQFEGTILAGAIAPRTGTRAFYLYAASTRDEELTKKRGPYAVMGALERSLRDAGSETLDLWGVREPDDDSVDDSWEGFSVFKRRFGGQPVRHPGTFDLIIDPTWYRLRALRERVRSRSR